MHNVNVYIDSRRAKISADDETLALLDDYWSYSSPGAFYSPSFQVFRNTHGKAGWDGKIRLLKRGYIPAGLLRATYKDILEKLDIKFTVTKDRPKIDFQPGLPDITDPKYSYQNDAVNAMLYNTRKGGGIILASTGAGKTATTARYLSKVPYFCMFIVDQLTLLDQAQEEIQKWLGEPVGIVGRSVFAPERVTVATIQTLKLHEDNPVFRKWFKLVKVVIVDELHDLMAKANVGLLADINPIAVFGLTATLQLKKKDVRLRAYAFAGPVIFEFPLEEALERGVSTKGYVLQLQFPQDQQYTSSIDEYEQEVINNDTKIASWRLLASYLEKEGRFIVSLADRRPHMARLCANAPHKYELAMGGVSKNDRKSAMKAFDAGDLKHIIASKVFRKGVDIGRIDAMFDLAERKSKNDAAQKFGRGVRLFEDKEELLYIDFATQPYKGSPTNLSKSAASRANALRAQGVQVIKVKISTPAEALETLKKFIGKVCKPETKQ